MTGMTKRVSLLVVALAAACGEGESSLRATPDPPGLPRHAVYVADGAFDPTLPPEGVADAVPSGLQGYWKSDHAYRLLNMSDTDIAARSSAAKAFYMARFGVDVDDPALATRIMYDQIITSPTMRYRLYELTGYDLPADGVNVWDTGFLVMVIDPAGLVLGGDFAGVTVPVGTVLAFGDYVIEVEAGEVINIQYRSLRPPTTLPSGQLLFDCELDGDLGPGLSQIVTQYGPVEGTALLQVSVRNHLTFFTAP